MKSICFPPTAFCLSTPASPESGTCATPAYSRLPTAFEGDAVEKVLRRHARPGQDVTSDSERKNY